MNHMMQRSVLLKQAAAPNPAATYMDPYAIQAHEARKRNLEAMRVRDFQRKRRELRQQIMQDTVDWQKRNKTYREGSSSVADVREAARRADAIMANMPVEKYSPAYVETQQQIKNFDDELARRQKANITDKQITANAQLENRATQAGSEAYIAARKADKSEAEAKQAAEEAATAVASGHVAGDGTMDQIWSAISGKGYDRAKALQRYGQYKTSVPRAQQYPTALRPETQQQLKDIGTADYVEKQKANMDWMDKGAYGAKQLWNVVSPTGTYVDEQNKQRQINQAYQSKMVDTGRQFAEGAQQAPERYVEGIKTKVGGFLKNNWGTLAGLGMGALALGMLGNLGRGQQQGRGQGGPQVRDPNDWAKESNFGRQGGAQVVQNPLSRTFTNFMKGGFGGKV